MMNSNGSIRSSEESLATRLQIEFDLAATGFIDVKYS